MKRIQKSSWYLLALAIVVFWLMSCARQGTLSGGPKDLSPPRLDTARSDGNYQTRFYPQAIRLYFDEWIQLKNKAQILISPPLANNPRIDFRGKYVEVDFGEAPDFRDSTTYAINFGNAIVDLNESNPLENFQFVFSTGDRIDSLILMGMVIDAFTRKPVKDVSVMLYDVLEDSVVYKEKPYYFSRTDKSGNFMIRHLRPGRFKCFALLDADFNFLYNQDSESIGFPDSFLVVHADSLPVSVEIELFLPIPDLAFVAKDIPARGKLKIKANRYIDSMRIEASNREIHGLEMLEDSLIVWYEPDTTIGQDSLSLVMESGSFRDSLVIKSKKNTRFTGSPLFASFRERQKQVLPGQTLSLSFNQIVRSVDTSFIIIREAVQPPIRDSLEADSLAAPPPPLRKEILASIDSADLRRVLLKTEWPPEGSFELTLLPGAIKGYFDNTNDTLISQVKLKPAGDLGTIQCRFSGLDSLQNYLVMLKIKDKIFERISISGVKNKDIGFYQLEPGKYQLEVIEDDNANDRWDPGNYGLRKQSERKVDIPLEELRKNWDIETDIKWEKP